MTTTYQPTTAADTERAFEIRLGLAVAPTRREPADWEARKRQLTDEREERRQTTLTDTLQGNN